MSTGGYEHRDFPEKSWSISRMKVINSCLREYYFQYYGSHNGWVYTSPEESKLAWRLKKLTNIWMLFGSKMHLAFKYNISQVCTGKKIMSDEMLVNNIKNQLNFVVRDSIIKHKNGQWDEYPTGEMLQEYYYDEKLSDAVIIDVKERLKVCSTNFFSSKTVEDIIDNSFKVIENDEGTFQSIEVNGIKVYSLIDTLYVDDMGNFIIVDWKTGNYSEEDKEQLLVYALYVMEVYKVPIEKIIGRVEYLLSGEDDEYRFTEENIKYIKDRIEMDKNVINAFLKNTANNEPKSREDFIKCDIKNKCKLCKFKRLCEEEMEELSYEAN